MSRSRAVINPKEKAKTDGLAVIIPAAGLGHRMRSSGPKCLLEINGQTLLDRQIEIWNRLFKPVEIIVIGGFEIESIEKAVVNKARLVYNHLYESTNVTYSIYLGLINTIQKNVIISYGDLYFNDAAVRGINALDYITVVGSKNMHEREVGYLSNGAYVSSFNYSSPLKWGHITYVPHQLLSVFRKTVKQSAAKKQFLYEALNSILEKNSHIVAMTNIAGEVTDIDTGEDFRKLIDG